MMLLGRRRRVVQAPAVAYPSTRSDIFAWFSAKSGITLAGGSGADQNNVTAWADKSGNNRHCLQNVAGKHHTYEPTGFNGRPCLTAPDGNRHQIFFGYTLPQPYTILAVAYSTSTAVAYQYLCDDNVAGDTRFVIYETAAGPKPGISATSNGVAGMVTGPAASVTQFQSPSKVASVHNGANSFVRVNGVNGATGNMGTGTFTGLKIGSSGYGTYGLIGKIAEVIIVAGAVDATGLSSFDAYFNTEWNLT